MGSLGGRGWVFEEVTVFGVDAVLSATTPVPFEALERDQEHPFFTRECAAIVFNALD